MQKIITKLVLKREYRLQSYGDSMLPLLQNKDLIFYRKSNFGQIKINELILIKKNHQQYFTHRVIYKTNNYIITKGDNNIQSDNKIYPQQIIGKVTKVKRKESFFSPDNLYLIQSTLYLKEINNIFSILNYKNINFTVLKGLPLHLYFEGSHPRRIYADCDILIDKKNQRNIENILEKNGYIKADSPLSPTQKKLQDKESELHYFKKINGFMVMFDLHFEPVFMMTQLGRLDELYPQQLLDQLTQEFLDNRQIVKINSSSFPLLSSHFQIIYLALHFFHHNFSGIFRLELIKNIIIKIPEKNQKKLQNNIVTILKKFHLQSFSYWSFVLLQKYYPETKAFLLPIFKAIKPEEKYLRYLKSLKINVFDDEDRFHSGITRFKNLFFLSPEPIWKRLMVFLNPQVIYSILWTMYQKIRTFKRRA